MKKTVLILLMAAIALSSLFAKSAEVQLNSNIDEAPLVYKLYRELETKELIEITDETPYVVSEINPLTTNTMITDFIIIANSNSNSDKSISVTITPGTFKTYLNEDEEYDTEITPIINVNGSSDSILPAGLNTDKEVYRFNIFVNGKPNLPAGDYVSIVNVEYKIE